MKITMLVAAAALAALAGCASQPPVDPMHKDAQAYVEKPDYDFALVCDTRFDDLRKCEAAIKTMCGERGFLDLRIRPLREPGTSTESTAHRLLQVQCKPRG